MLDSIYHMIYKLLENGVKTLRFCHLLRNVIIDVIALRYENCKPLVVLNYQFYCMMIHHS